MARAMLDTLHHRGPESYGFYAHDAVSLGHARLSIVDLDGGRQPLTNEDQTLWLVANGAVFNHDDLRRDLRARGHRFRTESDCEVILHLYEEGGPEAFTALNGQYAFALWDARRRRLVLCRDRMGICPLFYTFVGDRLYFASEVKALLRVPEVRAVRAVPDLDMLGAIWTTWTTPPGATAFAGISELLPAHYAVYEPGDRALAPVRYWQLDFAERDDPSWTFDEAREAFDAALRDAVRLRLHADVPVGAYLSGGLNSSVTTALARDYARTLHTFSVAFEDSNFDESAYQQTVARHLGTEHHVLRCDREMLAAALPEVIAHAEAPQLRAEPVSMYLLSGLVRSHDFKAVITGEGADEFLMGYDIFRETAVRRFMARDPHSAMRRRLTRHLSPYLPDRDRLQHGLELTFQQGLDRAADPLFSHDLRWSHVAALQGYFAPEVRARLAPNREALLSRLAPALPEGFAGWNWAGRAQTLEVLTFLSPYLLASRGDRVAMAHTVEGRFPFLDHRVIELLNSMPVAFKMRSLTRDKHLLRRLAADSLPAEISRRPTVPDRTPIREIVRARRADYIDDLLAPSALAATGLFAPQSVGRLLQKVRTAPSVSEMDEMALFGILTTQLWHRRFIAGNAEAPVAAPATVSAEVAR